MSRSNPSQRDPAARIDELLGVEVALGRLSGAVLVTAADRELYAGAFGEAERKTGRPNLRSTCFRVGSVSKMLTAAAALHLEAAGMLDRDAPLGRVLPQCPPHLAERITVAHLLGHSSGIPSLFRPHEGVRAPSVAEMGRPVSRASLLGRFCELPLRFPPGSRVEYSNSGYTLLAVIVEELSGLSLAAYLERHVLRPAGMARTGLAGSAATTGQEAVGYCGPFPALARAPAIHPSWLLGAGDLSSTVDDLRALSRALVRGAFLPPDLLLRAFPPAPPDASATLGDAGETPAGVRGEAAAEENRDADGAFGPGCRWRTLGGREVLRMDGALPGFAAVHLHAPLSERTVTVLTNVTLPPPRVERSARYVVRIAERLLALALDEEPPDRPPRPAGLSREERGHARGTFALDSERHVTLVWKDDTLWACTAGHRPWTLAGALRSVAPEQTPGARRCLAFLEALAAGRFASAARLISPSQAAALHARRLRATWEAIRREHGELASQTVLDAHGGAVFLCCRFAHRELDLRVGLDPGGVLEGFFFVPSIENTARSLPLVVESAVRFVVDRYRSGAEELRLELRGDELVLTGERQLVARRCQGRASPASRPTGSG